MSDFFWLRDAQMARLQPFFPKLRGMPRVDDKRVLSGIIFNNLNELRWRYPLQSMARTRRFTDAGSVGARRASSL